MSAVNMTSKDPEDHVVDDQRGLSLVKKTLFTTVVQIKNTVSEPTIKR